MIDVKCVRCNVTMKVVAVSSRSCTTTFSKPPGMFDERAYVDNYWMHHYLIAHDEDKSPSNKHVPIEEYETVRARQCPECGMIELFANKVM